MKLNRPHPEAAPRTANVAVIESAMQSDKTLNFVYDGKLKVVEAHALGTSRKDGSIIMRGWQVAGHSSRPLPCWGLYSVDKIELLELGSEPSEAPRDGYVMGDAHMNNIIAELDIENA